MTTSFGGTDAETRQGIAAVGFAVDRGALHREFPDVVFHDFESWAKRQDWSVFLESA
jgi:hypothetical protein